MEKGKYDKTLTKVTYVIAAIVVIAIVYFIFVKPYLTFRSYEKQMRAGAERYYQINARELPTGKRVSTVTLSTLSSKQFIEEDFTIPFSSKLCNIKDSWVKVKTDGADYKYYVYLDCGFLESKVDHEGPIIKLNGDQEMTLTKHEKYEEPGVSSVIDKNDGKMNTKDVNISGDVNTKTTGTYKVTYTAFDSLKNKTEVVRTIHVIETILSVTKRTNPKGFYPADSENNHIYFSNQLYRILGIDGDNVKIISNDVVGVSNYAAIDKQLDNYYKTLSSKSKKFIVKNKYCNDQLSRKNVDTTECSSYTDPKNLYIPSIADINKIKSRYDGYILNGQSMWTSNKYNDNYSYLVGVETPEENEPLSMVINTYNGGIRPVITLRGDTVISKGNGSFDNPFVILKDVRPGKAGELINKRLPGEFITLGGNTWRIIEPQNDGTTKIVLNDTITTVDDDLQYNDIGNEQYEYNPKKKNTYAYYINNKASMYLQTDKLVSHQIKVPIYKEAVLYGKEIDTKTYKVKLSAPSLYDLYSISICEGEYITINTSQEDNNFFYISTSGGVVKRGYDGVRKYSVKPVGFLKKGTVVVDGNGTEASPYSVE